MFESHLDILWIIGHTCMFCLISPKCSLASFSFFTRYMISVNPLSGMESGGTKLKVMSLTFVITYWERGGTKLKMMSLTFVHPLFLYGLALKGC